MENYVIGIDTSGDSCSVALVKKGHILGAAFKKAPGNQLVQLVPLINDLMEEIEADRVYCRGIGITTGPGGYTGLRLGLATAKTMAQVMNVPLVGMNTLDIIARNAPAEDQHIIPIMDARKNEFFYATYRYNPGPISKKSSYNIGGLENLFDFISGHDSKIDVLGSGIPIIRNSIKKGGFKNVRILPEELWYPKAEIIAIEAEKALDRGEGRHFREVEIFYLREPDAIPLDKQRIK